MVRPSVNSTGQKELDKAQNDFDKFEENINSLTVDRMAKVPLEEKDPQTKISTREANKADAPYIKPFKSINSKEKANERFAELRRKSWEYVKVIVENNEIIGETIEAWTKRWPGDNADFWKVPVNKPIYIPKLLAEQLAGCRYHRLVMQENTPTSFDEKGTYYGAMVADTTKQRLDCRTVGENFVSMSLR
jgi:hypothetical protein